MTREESIKEALIDFKESVKTIKEHYDDFFDEYKQHMDKSLEHFEIGIEALEKQIRKPKEHFHEDNGFLKCTKTGKVIRYPLVSFRDLEYCPRCGQAIDWGVG